MKVAFYKGRKRLFNRLVAWYLRGDYSHCELILSESIGVSECASSSYLDGGVRTKRMVLDPEHWDIIEVGGDENYVRSWLSYYEEDRYDILGLLGFVWRRESGMSEKWFCSEAVAAMLGIEEPWRFDPMNLYFALKAR